MQPRSQGHPIPSPEPLPEQLWQVGDLAKYFRKSRHAIYKMVERRQLPFVKVGQAVRFNPPVIREWIARHSVAPISPRPSVDRR
jgi:excisionase family DNA binding protein